MAARNPPTPRQPQSPQPAQPIAPPPAPRRRGVSRTTIALWVVVVGLAAFFVPLNMIASGVRNDAVRINGDIQLIQKSLTAVPTPAPEVQKLMTAVAQVEGPAKEVKDAQATITAGRTDWRSVMSAIGNYDSNQLTLTALNQNGNQIILNGRAASDSAVTTYVRALESSSLFSRVVVQSIKVIGTPTTTITGTVLPPLVATLTSTAAITTTVFPATGDVYEIDDFSPKDIILNQPQRHSFFPVYDVDKVKFLAKAGRSYRIRTFDLTPGVDTFLSVNVGGVVYSNDDDQPGDLASEVDFQAASGSDVQAIATVTNRGQYGPDKGYSIVVEETIPTATPTPGPTATPTNTPAPPNTFTPTPDLRDKYEPDDTNPQPIAIGETQGHSFYPNGDVDKVKFLAKAGRFYQVSTSDLALGVDTVLDVNVGGTVYTSDDRQPGDLSSEVKFQVPPGSDLQVIVTVTNKGQYGPDKTYNLTAKEIVPTSVPPTPPTATPTATPNLRDKYEPDDVDPKSIAIGETQGHTFYPEGDVDKVKFLAKAGRFYRVSTSNLPLGVDTFLELNVGGTVYTNDDRQPGDLSSEVNFQVPLNSDVPVTVTITNRGQFGTEKGYNLTVVEFIPTPTSTPTRVITTTSGVMLYPVTLKGLWQEGNAAAQASDHFASMAPVASLIGSVRLLPDLALSFSAQMMTRRLAFRPMFTTILGEQPVGSVNAQTQTVEFVIVLELKR